MTSTIILAAICLIALGTYAVISTAQRIEAEQKQKNFERRRRESYIGRTSYR